MKTAIIGITTLISLAIATPIQAQSIPLFSGRGEYIGDLDSNSYNNNSICNEYGQFGGEYSSQSIFNQYGNNGSSYSSTGAYNDNAQSPPYFYFKGSRIYVSTNSNIPNRISPGVLYGMVCKSGR